MGGSGGGYFGGGRPEARTIADKLREAEQATADGALAAEVNELLGAVLANANDRDTDANAHNLDEIAEALEFGNDDMVSFYFGGSVSKHTYVDGISDIDALLILNQTDMTNKKPAVVCAEILSQLRAALPYSVKADGFAITVEFPNSPVQIVPAIRKGEDYLLPSNDKQSWSKTRPKKFTDQLTSVNKSCNGKVIPTIKLVKVLLTNLPNARRPSGYHLENLAVEAFASYTGPKTPRAMLHHFFDQAPKLIRQPITDRSGQSRYVDENLGKPQSTKRLIVADAVDRIGRRLRNADGSGDINQWRSLFDMA